MVHHAAFAALLVAGSVAMGTAGYMLFDRLPLVDAFLNASMLLGGMGPVDPLVSNPAKIFAALFALYSGLVFLIVAGVMVAPLIHRVMHRFHWDQKQ
jgi:hypothetical protein